MDAGTHARGRDDDAACIWGGALDYCCVWCTRGDHRGREKKSLNSRRPPHGWLMWQCAILHIPRWYMRYHTGMYTYTAFETSSVRDSYCLYRTYCPRYTACYYINATCLYKMLVYNARYNIHMYRWYICGKQRIDSARSWYTDMLMHVTYNAPDTCSVSVVRNTDFYMNNENCFLSGRC